MMAGAMLGAAEARRIVIVDGFIAAAAALVAVALDAQAAGALVFAHRSAEHGHAALLAHLGAEPLLDLGMRLGEGTGALLAWPLVRAAAAMLTEMSSFDERRGQRPGMSPRPPRTRARADRGRLPDPPAAAGAGRSATRAAWRPPCAGSPPSASSSGRSGAAVFLLAGTVLGPVPALVVSTAAVAVLTGALHEDGLADTLDGLGGATRERALAIMRESAIGTYGALGLGLVVAARIAALAGMARARPRRRSSPATASAGCRWSSSWRRAAMSARRAPRGFAASGVASGDLAVAGATGIAHARRARRRPRAARRPRRRGGNGARARARPRPLRAAPRRLHRRLPRRDPAAQRGRADPRGGGMPLTLLRHTTPAVGPEVCYGASDVALAPGFEAEAAAVLARLPRTGADRDEPPRPLRPPRRLPRRAARCARNRRSRLARARFRRVGGASLAGDPARRGRGLGGGLHGRPPPRWRERRDAPPPGADGGGALLPGGDLARGHPRRTDPRRALRSGRRAGAGRGRCRSAGCGVAARPAARRAPPDEGGPSLARSSPRPA